MHFTQHLVSGLVFLPAIVAVALPEVEGLVERQAGAASGVCTQNLLYRILLPLSTNAGALAFCTSRFPVTATTTALSTSVSTVTTTTTTIIREYKNKRQASGSGLARAAATTPALLASLQTAAASFARTVCSCIAQPVTTVTSTIATTTTTTVSTAATSQGTCVPGTRTGQSACSCSYNVLCKKSVGFGGCTNYQILKPASNLQDCTNQCDQYSDCGTALWTPDRRSCNYYSTKCTITLYDSIFDYAVAQRDSCNCQGPSVPS